MLKVTNILNVTLLRTIYLEKAKDLNLETHSTPPRYYLPRTFLESRLEIIYKSLMGIYFFFRDKLKPLDRDKLSL